MFGKRIVSASWISDTLLECLTLPMPAGTTVEVRVSNNGVDFSESSASFSYKGARALFFFPLSPPKVCARSHLAPPPPAPPLA
jgi:hypothetical protein